MKDCGITTIELDSRHTLWRRFERLPNVAETEFYGGAYFAADPQATHDAEAGKALREWLNKWGYRDDLELEAEVRFFHCDEQAAEFAAIVAMAVKEE
jgi:hypothetical protein